MPAGQVCFAKKKFSKNPFSSQKNIFFTKKYLFCKKIFSAQKKNIFSKRIIPGPTGLPCRPVQPGPGRAGLGGPGQPKSPKIWRIHRKSQRKVCFRKKNRKNTDGDQIKILEKAMELINSDNDLKLLEKKFDKKNFKHCGLLSTKPKLYIWKKQRIKLINLSNSNWSNKTFHYECLWYGFLISLIHTWVWRLAEIVISL